MTMLEFIVPFTDKTAAEKFDRCHGTNGELVRCADCKYWQDNNGGYPHEDCRWGHDETPDPDDYCSYAKRRANDG